MSVYKRKGEETYTFDFVHKHRRFSGDTGETEKRKALAYQSVERDKAKALMAELAKLDAPQNWKEASSRWYDEVGQHHANLELTLLSMAWLDREIGGKTPLLSITDNTVARLVAKRRGEFRKVGNAKTAKTRVSNATVNRMVTEPLRKVLTRARKIWKVPVNDVQWTEHLLSEPQERVREASRAEEHKVMARLTRGYAEAVKFTLMSGCRRMEVVALKKTKVDFFTRNFTVMGKGSKERTIPMSDAIYDLLWSIKDAPGEFVFTYEAQRTDKRKKLIKGQRYPITDAGLRTAFRRAVDGSGIDALRFHDLRHTAATRTLRKSNLRVVQHLLGHSNVATTAKYAHAQTEDIRAALNAVSPTKSPVARDAEGAKILGDKGETG
jgi:integrase